MPKRGARGLEKLIWRDNVICRNENRPIAFRIQGSPRKGRYSSLPRGQAAGFSQAGADGGGGLEARLLGYWGLPGGSGTQKMQIMTLKEGTHF